MTFRQMVGYEYYEVSDSGTIRNRKTGTIQSIFGFNNINTKKGGTNVSKRKQINLEVIERWLKDSDWRVRAAAMNACKKNGIPVPITRTIEPPESVYKKCVADVIVVAHIPDDAHVRGAVGKKCRASKAIITDVIGTFAGEKVGISNWDKKTTYFIGDEVEVEDFDMSNEECSTGFHFFCTREEAEKY